MPDFCPTWLYWFPPPPAALLLHPYLYLEIPYLISFANLMSVKCYLIAVLICISLISCEVIVFYMSISNLALLCELVSISFAYFCLCVRFYWFVAIFTFRIIILWQLHTMWTFSSLLCFSFIFLLFWCNCHVVFNTNREEFFFFLSLCLVLLVSYLRYPFLILFFKIFFYIVFWKLIVIIKNFSSSICVLTHL